MTFLKKVGKFSFSYNPAIYKNSSHAPIEEIRISLDNGNANYRDLDSLSLNDLEDLRHGLKHFIAHVRGAAAERARHK